MTTRTVSVGVAWSLLAGIACKTTVKPQSAEEIVRKQVSALGLSPTKVTCPSDVEARSGARFACQLELDGKHRYEISAAVGEVDTTTGNVSVKLTWRDGVAVVVAKLELATKDELNKKFGSPVTVLCGEEPVRFLDPKRTLTCDLLAGDLKSQLTIEFNAEIVPTSWELDPPLLSAAKLTELLTPRVREKTASDIRVDCGPAAFLILPADRIVWCTVSTPDESAKLKVELNDQLNLQRWELIPSG
jgi:hypothetical protein